MRKKGLCILVLLILGDFFSIHAQSTNYAEDSAYSATNNLSATKSILKIEPLGFLHGSIPFSFERRLSNAFTIEGAVGLTTGYNYLREKYLNFRPTSHYEDSIKYMNVRYRTGNRNDRKSSIGYLFIVQPRFYFGKQAPSGFYTGLSVEYYRFRSLRRHPQVSGNTLVFTGPTADEDEYERDVRVNLGYQKLLKKVTVETAVSVGWMDVKGKKLAAALLPGNRAGSASVRYGRSGFNYHLTLQVGYQFANVAGKIKSSKKITANPATETTSNFKLKRDRKRTISLHKNILKIAPFGFFSGVYPVLYERKLAETFSVQVGAGFTSRNHIRSAFLNIGDNGSPVHYTYFPPFTNIYNDDAGSALGRYRRKGALGYMFTVQPRIYFKSNAPNGSFIGFSYDFFRCNLTYPKVQGFQQFTGPLQKEHENIQDLMVVIGYQALYYRKISIEGSLGIGLRSVKGTKYVAKGINDGFATYTDDRFYIGLGIKAGYHF